MMGQIREEAVGFLFNLEVEVTGTGANASAPIVEARGLGGSAAPNWISQYMSSVGVAIAGGTANGQRNVIAERGFGLPRDAAANRSKK